MTFFVYLFGQFNPLNTFMTFLVYLFGRFNPLNTFMTFFVYLFGQFNPLNTFMAFFFYTCLVSLTLSMMNSADTRNWVPSWACIDTMIWE